MTAQDRIRREIISTLDASEWGLSERMQDELTGALMDVLCEIGVTQPDGSFVVLPHKEPES